MPQYRSPATPRRGWTRPTPAGLWDGILLIEDDRFPYPEDDAAYHAIIATWSDYEMFLVAEYVWRTHLRASDNTLVRVPPRPAILSALDILRTQLEDQHHAEREETGTILDMAPRRFPVQVATDESTPLPVIRVTVPGRDLPSTPLADSGDAE